MLSLLLAACADESAIETGPPIGVISPASSASVVAWSNSAGSTGAPLKPGLTPTFSAPGPTTDPRTTNPIFGALMAEGWQIDPATLRVEPLGTGYRLVQFQAGVDRVARVFDRQGQSVNDPTTVVPLLTDRAWATTTHRLSQGERAKVQDLLVVMDKLQQIAGPLAKMRQELDPLLRQVDKLKNISMPRGGLPLLRNAWDAACWLPGEVVLVGCLAEPLVRGVGDSATAVQQSLGPARESLQTYLQIYDTGSGSQLKAQTELTTLKLGLLNTQLDQLDQQAEQIKLLCQGASDWIDHHEVLGAPLHLAGIPQLLQKAQAGIGNYQQAVENRAVKVAEVQDLLAQTEQDLNRQTRDLLQAWARQP